MKKNYKNIIIVIISLIIVLLITGGVYAYLTDTDHATNVFTQGSIKISLTEPNWNPSNGTDLRPGNTIAKDPQINNIGKNEAYVYIKVEQPIVELMNGTKSPLFSYTTNSGWTLLGDNSSQSNCPVRTSVYYYNTALAKNTSTSKLFNNVTVSNFSQTYIEYLDMTNSDMKITGYAIQTRNLPSGTTIQNAYNTYFDSGSIGECPSDKSIYRWSSNSLYIGESISSLTEGVDYVTDVSQITSLDPRASKCFIKHDIYNNRITKSHACFVVTTDLASANSGMTVGEYCLKGGDNGASYSTNKSILTTAFGSTHCTDYSTEFFCNVSGLSGQAFDDGRVFAGNYGYSCCHVFVDGRTKSDDGLT